MSSDTIEKIKKIVEFHNSLTLSEEKNCCMWARSIILNEIGYEIEKYDHEKRLGSNND